MCFHVTAINENVSWVCLYDILVRCAMYLMRPTYRYCSFTLRLLDLTLKVKEGTLFFTPAFSLQTENRAAKCPGHPFLNFLNPPLKRQSRCSKEFSRAVHHLRFWL